MILSYLSFHNEFFLLRTGKISRVGFWQIRAENKWGQLWIQVANRSLQRVTARPFGVCVYVCTRAPPGGGRGRDKKGRKGRKEGERKVQTDFLILELKSQPPQKRNKALSNLNTEPE